MTQITINADKIEINRIIKFRKRKRRAHPDLNQVPADLQSAALTTELCTPLLKPGRALKRFEAGRLCQVQRGKRMRS